MNTSGNTVLITGGATGIGYGSSEDSRIATREELDRRFFMMNNR